VAELAEELLETTALLLFLPVVALVAGVFAVAFVAVVVLAVGFSCTSFPPLARLGLAPRLDLLLGVPEAGVFTTKLAPVR